MKLKSMKTLIPKNPEFQPNRKNSKNEDLLGTPIYTQFQLKDEIETNQNLYNSRKGQKNKS